MSENTSKSIPTGVAFEVEVLGVGSSGNPAKIEYASFDECLWELSEQEDWEPTPTMLIWELLQIIRNTLPEITVNVIPAIGTRLDILHGVDGIFRATNTKGNVALFFFDLTTHSNVKIKPGISLLKPADFKGEKLQINAAFIVRTLSKGLKA